MYSEVRNDYIHGPAVEGCSVDPDEDGMLAAISIDAWKTANDNEPGETVASVILSRHGDIIVDWHNNSARMLRSVRTAIKEARQQLIELWNELSQTTPSQKLYYLKDDQGDLDLIRVNNWDDNFDQHMSDAFDQYQASQEELHESFYGRLQAFGYDIEVLDCDVVNLA